MEVIIIKLEELVVLLYEYEIVEIRMDKKKIFEGKICDFKYLDYKDLELIEIYSYGDIKDYDTTFSVMCIDCKSERCWFISFFYC